MGGGDHYQTLGIPRDASKADVKAAFSRLALLHHPDRHAKADEATRAEATRRFREVYDAYQVLYDDDRRAAYDCELRFRSSSSSSSASGGYGQGGASASSSSSASCGCGHGHEHCRGFQYWPSPRGDESMWAWTKANWYPLFRCSLEVAEAVVTVARAVVAVAELVVEGRRVYNSWTSSMEWKEKEKEAVESKEKETVGSKEKDAVESELECEDENEPK